MTKITQSQWQQLSENALGAFTKAYAPYSHFRVGAAALTESGVLVQGCNVENASYGLTVCAERNCIAQGVINHNKDEALKFTALVVYTNQDTLTPPCGACRQVIAEFFSPDSLIKSVNHNNDEKVWRVDELLPDAFTPQNLFEKNN